MHVDYGEMLPRQLKFLYIRLPGLLRPDMASRSLQTYYATNMQPHASIGFDVVNSMVCHRRSVHYTPLAPEHAIIHSSDTFE